MSERALFQPLPASLVPVESLPFPQGWFCLGMASSLEPRQVRAVRLAGQELVLFRGVDGQLGLLHAYCPHLGAHLGHGGKVTDSGSISCPFHGFEFDRGGACTAIAYGSKPPPTAKVRAHRVVEWSGLMLAWFDPQGRDPSWEPPSLELEGFSPWATTSWVMRGHPQETSENSVDIGHFGLVHGYQQVTADSRATTEGPTLSTDYSFQAALFPGSRVLTARMPMNIRVRVLGLGVSVVQANAPTLGLEFKLLVLPTPLEAGQIELRIGLAVKDLNGARWWHQLVPRWLMRRLLPRQLVRIYAREIAQDFELWRHKRFAPRPTLAEGDGPIGLYRQWVRQFYPGTQAE